jgi:hypothetical protein
MMVLLLAVVLGPSLVALALLGLTRRCEQWLEADGRRPVPALAQGPGLAPGLTLAPGAGGVADAAGDPVFAA